MHAVHIHVHVLYILQHYIFVLCITTCTLYICIYLVVVLLHVTVIMYTHVHVLMRDWKEEASKVKQTTSQSNTAHPRQSLFLRKMTMSIHVYL